MIIAGVEDVDGLFKSVSSDALIAKMLPYSKVIELARSVGVSIPKKRLYEIDLVARIRKGLIAGTQPRPCSGCVLSGRRWHKLNTGQPLLLRLDRPSLAEAYQDAEEVIYDAINLIQTHYPQVSIRETLVGEFPDVHVGAEAIDGRFGTLGFATTYLTEGSDDLDVGGDRWISATLTADSAEYWTYGFFFTVFLHELLHILGLDHAPDEFDDIMRATYAGDRRTLGPWTDAEMLRRHVGVLPA